LKEFRTVNLLRKEDLEEALMSCASFGEAMQVIKPLVLAYIQCSLPLEELVKFYQSKFQPQRGYKHVRITAQDLFDWVLFQGDEDVKALMLERYSNIYPVPLLISQYQSKLTHFLYQCAYFIQPCKTILSFGILKASWTRCGKSSLIDELFSTDFTCNHRGNFDARTGANGAHSSGRSTRSIYDIGRIDIQMPRNIDSYEAETQWQFLDVSRFCDPKILDTFCWKVNALIIHVMATDLVSLTVIKVKEIISKYLKF
jgi:hypothetical protein